MTALSSAETSNNDGVAAGEIGLMRIARRRWRRALRLDPTCVRALWNLGTYAERPSEALMFARRAVEAEPDHPMSHYVLAYALLAINYKIPALRALREFLARVDLLGEEHLHLLATAANVAEGLQRDVLIST